MEYILNRYGIRHHEWTLSSGTGQDGMDGIAIKQKDGSNCGPIACMVLWKLFKAQEVNLQIIPPSKYRQLVLDELHRFINTHEAACVVFKRKKRIPGVVGFYNGGDTDKIGIVVRENTTMPSQRIQPFTPSVENQKMKETSMKPQQEEPPNITTTVKNTQHCQTTIVVACTRTTRHPSKGNF